MSVLEKPYFRYLPYITIPSIIHIASL